MKQPYPIPQATLEHCYEVKKSKFIARIAHVENRCSAMAILAQTKLDYPDARHHCWAYVLGDPKQPSNAAFNDDGEPSGTAGKPILNVLNHRGIGDIIIVVIRYFGGIKLGTGGLVRAYSTAAHQAIEQLTTKQFVPTTTLTIRCEYACEPDLRRFLQSQQSIITDSHYNMELLLTADIPLNSLPITGKFIASRNGIVLEQIDGKEI